MQPLAVFVRGLWVARSIFGRLADGMVIEPQTGVLLRRFGISEYEIALAIVGMLIRTTGSVMAEAVRMAEENRQVI